jgi:phage-related minor tail protein
MEVELLPIISDMEELMSLGSMEIVDATDGIVSVFVPSGSSGEIPTAILRRMALSALVVDTVFLVVDFKKQFWLSLVS